MNPPRIRLALFEPEECSLSIAKSPQIGMAVLPFVGHEELDVERRQRRFVERQRVFSIAHGQDNVVDHIVPFKLPASRSFSRRRGWVSGGSAGWLFPRGDTAVTRRDRV